MPKMKEVIATRKGLKNGRIVNVGDVFEVEVGSRSKWYADVGEKTKQDKNTADLNGDGNLDKAEILKWFESNNLQVDASLGVVALRKAYDAAKTELEASKTA